MRRRPPFETFKGATCRGSYVLGTACGHCERCKWEEAERLAEQKPAAPLTKHTTLCEMRIRTDATIEPGVIVMAPSTKQAIDEHTKLIREKVWDAFGILSTDVFIK